MRNGFYRLPFRPKEILEGGALSRDTDVERAITSFISMVLRTAPGEVPGDMEFGCRIWDHLAEPIRGERWLSQMTEDVRQAIVRHERRLQDVTVDISPTRGNQLDLTLVVEGRIVPTGKPYRFERVIRTDPIRIA